MARLCGRSLYIYIVLYSVTCDLFKKIEGLG